MNTLDNIKKRNSVVRFINKLSDSDVELLENHLIQQDYEINDEETEETPLVESLNLDETVLDKDIQAKLKVLFEAKVNERVLDKQAVFIKETNEKMNEYGEYLKDQLTEQFEADLEKLEESLDSYLDYVISEWVQENTLAIEKGVKVQLAESVMVGLKKLFSDNHIDVPDEKINLISTLETKAKKLYENNISLHETNRNLKQEVIDLKKKLIVESCSDELTLTQKERLQTLSESIAVKSSKEFRKQVELMKKMITEEKEVEKTPKTSPLLTETKHIDEIDPQVKKYLDVITKM